MPCGAFWSELMDTYPRAKIVLVERDVEAWYRSFEAVILGTVFSWKAYIIIAAMRIGLLSKAPGMFICPLLLNYFRAENTKQMARNSRAVYTEHYASIRAKAEAEGRPVLDMELDEGWEPLCKFLGNEVLAQESPRGNEAVKAVEHTSRAHHAMLRQFGQKLARTIGMVGVADLGIVFSVYLGNRY